MYSGKEPATLRRNIQWQQNNEKIHQRDQRELFGMKKATKCNGYYC
jgi:hypothetical protein